MYVQFDEELQRLLAADFYTFFNFRKLNLAQKKETHKNLSKGFPTCAVLFVANR